MREEYDFSQAKRAHQVPHLAKLQAESGKTRVNLDFRSTTLIIAVLFGCPPVYEALPEIALQKISLNFANQVNS